LLIILGSLENLGFSGSFPFATIFLGSLLEVSDYGLIGFPVVRLFLNPLLTYFPPEFKFSSFSFFFGPILDATF